MKKTIVGIIFLSLGLVACPQPPVVLLDANVRFLNTVADSGGLKIFLKGVRENEGSLLGFKAALPSLNTYKTIKEGTLTYSLCPDNSQDCPIAVKDKTVGLAGLEKKTVVLVGTNATNDDAVTDARPLEIVTLKDESSSPVAGKAMLRVLHTTNTPTAKTIGVHITAPDAPLVALPSFLDYKKNTEYITLDAGNWRVRGTVSSTTVVDSAILALAADKTYTAVLVNDGVVLLTDK
jgi:hypothetical protein